MEDWIDYIDRCNQEYLTLQPVEPDIDFIGEEDSVSIPINY